MPEQTNVTINITSTGGVQSGDDNKHISKSANNVIWHALNGGGPWIVSFGANSPLDTEPISVPRGDGSTPVAVRQDAVLGTYSYTIADQGGGGADPHVIIET